MARNNHNLVLFIAALVQSGCAPAARLTFPHAPISEDSEKIQYDLHGKELLLFKKNGRIEALSCDDHRVYRLDDYDPARVPHLIVLLDSLPFEYVADRYAAGDFRWFDPPQKVI